MAGGVRAPTLRSAFALGLGLAAAGPAAAADATIFVAASLTDVIGELAEGFEQETGRELTIVPGSSSTLARQILAGAPADSFISANQLYAVEVAKTFETRAYDLFGNSLAIIAPVSFEGEVTLDQLPELLGDGRLALGDPEHVPAGIYAQEALENAGLWDALADRLAPAGDVRAAVAFVAGEAAPFGIVYLTDGQLEGVHVVGRFDPNLHTPVRYWGVTLDPENETVDMFFSYIGSMKGENLLDYLGFDVGRDFDFLNADEADD